MADYDYEISQVFVEVLQSASSPYQYDVSQVFVEVLQSSTNPYKYDITQVFLEVLKRHYSYKYDITQVFNEVLFHSIDPEYEISQVFVEVLVSQTPKPSNPYRGFNMLLILADVNGIERRTSNMTYNLTHEWTGYVLSFSNPTYKIDQLYGGYVRLDFGSIEFIIDFFNQSPSDFPPPITLPIQVLTSQTTEEEAVEIFDGVAHLDQFSAESATYSLFGHNDNTVLLNDSWGYDPNSINILVYGIWTWTQSTLFPTEWFLTLPGGGDPDFDARPARVSEAGFAMEESVVGSLQTGMWAWGHSGFDVGFDTIYIRLSDDTNPNTKTDPTGDGDGYIRADWGENETVYPRAFGFVEQELPLRMEDYKTKATYHNGFMSGCLAVVYFISGYFSYDSGKRTRITLTETHSLDVGDEILVERNERYAGTYQIYDVIDGTNILIDVPYGSLTTEYGWLSLRENWKVYDGGYPINSNVTDNEDYTVSLNSRPISEITISGKGEYSGLSNIFQWAASRIGLSYNDDNIRVPTPQLSYWAGSQETLFDFLSNIAAFFTHLFFVRGTVLYLLDMFVSGSTRDADLYPAGTDRYYESVFLANRPVSLLKTEYVKRFCTNTREGYPVVMEKTESVVLRTDYQHGDEMEVMSYSYDRAEIKECLENIMRIWATKQARCRFPFVGDPPIPGEEITYTDAIGLKPIDVIMRCRDITYDFGKDDVTISGEMI